MTDYVVCGRAPSRAGGRHRRPAWPRAACWPAARWSAARPPSTPGTSVRMTSTWPARRPGWWRRTGCSVPDRVRPGDVLIAMASSGLHSNGFSLVRKVIDEPGRELPLDRGAGRRSAARWATSCSTPTRIYARDCLALADACEVHAFAHITGGGLAANLSRVLPPGAGAALDRGTWRPPPVFGLLAGTGGSRGCGDGAGLQPGRRDDRRGRAGRGRAARWRCSPRGTCPPGWPARSPRAPGERRADRGSPRAVIGVRGCGPRARQPSSRHIMLREVSG